MILKLGERGIFAVGNIKSSDNSFSIPSFVNQVDDAVGAGDAMLSYSTLGLLATDSLLVAAILGSVAAACECEQNGNVTITPDLILDKITVIENSVKYKTK